MFTVACDNGWKHYRSSCYKYSNRQSRWTDAEGFCQRDGGHLPKITSREVQDFVFGLGLHQPFDTWIGLREQKDSGKFIWADGSPVGNFTFWSGGEPVQGKDVCVEMLRSDNNGRWRTGQCTVKHSSYVCQKGLYNRLILMYILLFISIALELMHRCEVEYCFSKADIPGEANCVKYLSDVNTGSMR